MLYFSPMRGRTTPNPRTPFGERLAAARQAAGFSQVALAKKLGIDRTLVRHNERKVADPKLNFLIRCCAALDLSLDELVDAPAAFKSQRSSAVDRLLKELRTLNHQEQKAVLRGALSVARELGRIERRRP